MTYRSVLSTSAVDLKYQTVQLSFIEVPYCEIKPYGTVQYGTVRYTHINILNTVRYGTLQYFKRNA